MMLKTKRFGLPYDPQKEKKQKKKLTKHIIIILCLIVLIVSTLSLFFSITIRNYVSCMAINESVDSTWISSLASYWGGIIGGIISGIFSFLGVFFTIKYYRESDEQKEKASIQPFLQVTIATDINPKRGFSLGEETDKMNQTMKLPVIIRNIGNGFTTTLVIHTEFNFGGFSYNKVITVGESENLFFMINPNDLVKGINFSIQYIDAMRNEYVQEYTIKNDHKQIGIECGYPEFLEQR